MPLGHLALILHAHLPFVRHPEHRDHLEERWLFEAIAECYLPLLEVFERLAEIKATAEQLAADEDAAKNELRLLLGEHTELVDEAGRTWATWRPSKPKAVTDWRAVAAALAHEFADEDEDPEDLLAGFAADHTTTKPGPRSLLTAPGLKLIKEP